LRKSLKRRTSVLLAAVSALVTTTALAGGIAGAITLTPFPTAFNDSTGIDYHESTDTVLTSANFPNGFPVNLEIIARDGTHAPFSGLQGVANTVRVATARSAPSCQQFPVGTVFTGNGLAGEIVRMSPGGIVAGPAPNNPGFAATASWVKLPGETAALQGGFYVDRFCGFAGDLIVATGDGSTGGRVWRVKADGSVRKLADITPYVQAGSASLEGVIALPPDVSRYASFANKILAGNPNNAGGPAVWVVGDNGAPDPLNASLTVVTLTDQFGNAVRAQDFDLIEAGSHFLGVDAGGARILSASPADFAAMAGDVLITQEFPPATSSHSGLYRLRFLGSTFLQLTGLLAQPGLTVGRWETVTFAPRFCPGAIGDFAWHDRNRNGVQDPGEPGLAGVTRTLRDQAGRVLQTRTTGPDGLYRFAGLCAGSYTVETTTAPPGFIPTLANASASDAIDSDPSPVTVVLATDSAIDDTIDAGFTSNGDVSVQKTTTTPTVNAGDAASYAVTVVAGGPGESFNVVLHDTLPAGLTWAVSGPDAGSCRLVGSALTCDFGTMPQGALRQISLSAATATVSCPSIQNTATVSADGDTDSTNNSAGPVTVDVTCPDVSVLKTALTPTVSAGSTATYELKVTAGGPGPSTSVTLTDTLPPGLTWSVGGPDAASCAIGSGVLTCGFGAMAPGTTRRVTVSATTTAASCPAIQNTATVTAEGDRDPSNNSSGPVPISVSCPDVSLRKTTSTPTLNPGGTAAYELRVTANGPGASNGVTLNDALPGGLGWTLGGPNAGACSITGNQLSCSFGSLAQGQTRQVNVSALVPVGTCPVLENTATVGADIDNDGGNNTSGPVEILVNCADVSVAKTTPTPALVAGDIARYDIAVTANGPRVSTGVTLTDTLRAGLAWSVGGPDAAACALAGNVLVCSFGAMSPGAVRQISVSALTSRASCPSIQNTAAVTAAADTNPDNNSSGPIRISVDCPDVSVTKSTTTPAISTGETAIYALRVSATGPGASTNVVLSDTLPPGLAWSASGPDAGACSIAGGVLTCGFGTIAPGSSRQVNVSALATRENCPSIRNTATVGAERDVDLTNNSSGSVTIAVACGDISLRKTTSTPTVSAGETVQYTLKVTANGPGASNDVVLQDDLPIGLAWSVGGPDAAACSLVGNHLSCAFGRMVESTSRQVTVSAATTAANCPSIKNTATVQASGDGGTGNNSAGPVTIKVNCPDIAVTKRPDRSSIVAGDIARFDLIVTAKGPGASTNVVLTDALPSPFAWSLSGPDAGFCFLAANQLTCNFGTMAEGSTRQVSVATLTTAADCGAIRNSVNVTAGEDTRRRNNKDGPKTINVNCPDVSVTKTAERPEITVGDTARYDITVTAHGSGSSSNVTLFDTVPSGLAWTVGGPDASACVLAAGQLTCSFGVLPQGSVRRVTLSAPTDPSVCGVIRNQATVRANPDFKPENDISSTVPITVTCPDVSVTKTTPSPTIVAGDIARYDIAVNANGPGTSRDITLVDILPPGLPWSLGGPDAGACSLVGNQLTCSFGSASQGSNKRITVAAPTTAAHCPGIHNTATVFATGDLNSSNNSSGPVGITVHCPDVSVLKSTPASSIVAGETARYDIVVAAGGTGNSTNVRLSDTLPSGLPWVLSGLHAGACSIDVSELTCNFGAMAPGSSRSLTVSATTTAANCTTVLNTVTVRANVDVDGGNNSSGPVAITVSCP
jgi:uncharacterized repeat protein (TIGR01451 family)